MAGFVSVKNVRKIKMLVPNGMGTLIELQPDEEKIVAGDYETIHGYTSKGLTGLVVKQVTGSRRLVEEKAKMDLARVLVTNHRQVPYIALAVGRGKSISLKPGETKETVAKLSVLKQNSGVTVRVLEHLSPLGVPKVGEVEPELEVNDVVKKTETAAEMSERISNQKALDAVEAAEIADAAAKAAVKAAETAKAAAKAAKEAEGKNDSALEAKAAAAAEAAALAAKEAEGSHAPLPANLKEQLGVPATKAEFLQMAKNLPMTDLRGVARRVEITGRSRNALITGVAEILYPGE